MNFLVFSIREKTKHKRENFQKHPSPREMKNSREKIAKCPRETFGLPVKS